VHDGLRDFAIVIGFLGRAHDDLLIIGWFHSDCCVDVATSAI
jgi:hypothetical protein